MPDLFVTSAPLSSSSARPCRSAGRVLFAPAQRRRSALLIATAAAAASDWLRTADATLSTVITAISPESISVNHATTITLTGSFASGDKAAFLTDCSTGTPSVDVSSGSADFTVVSSGNYFLCYQSSGQADSIRQTGVAGLTVVDATSATAISAVNPTGVTINYPTTISFTGHTSGDLAIFVPTGTCSSATPSVDISSGSGSFTLTSTGAYDLCLRANGGSDEVAQTNPATQVTVQAVTSATAISALSSAVITVGRNTLLELTFAGTAESGDKAILIDSATACSSATPSVDVSSGSGTFNVGSAGTYKLCFQEAGGSDSVEQTSVATVAASSVTQADMIASISPTSISVSTASTISFSPTPDSSDKAEFVTTGSACTGAAHRDISSGSATYTLGTATTYDLCVQATGMTDWVKQTGVSLTVRAATSTTQISALSESEVAVGVSVTISLTGHVDGSYAEFRVSGIDCSTITPSVAVANGGAGSFTFPSIGIYELCYRVSGGTDSVKQVGIQIVVTATGASADPIVWFGKTRRLFALPPGDLVELLHAPDMSIWGSTFEGSMPSEQWFGRMVIRSADSQRWLQVGIRKDLLSFNRSSAPRAGFDSIEVSMGGTTPDSVDLVTRVQTIDTPVPFSFFGADVAFRRVARNDQTQFPMIGKARRECVDFTGGYLHFYICSAGAWEYFGWQSHLAVKFAHLDLVVVEARRLSEEVSGLLPELWGIRPMSKEAASYILEETPAVGAEAAEALNGSSGARASNASGAEAGLCEGAAWAGGLRPEQLKGSCGAEAADSRLFSV